MLFGIIPLSVSALIIVCTLAKQSAARRAAAAAQAEKERADALKKRQREAQIRAAQEKAAQEKAARAALAIAKKAAAELKRQEREARAAAAHALKMARALELAELAERKLQAEKELAALKTRTETPSNHSAQEQTAEQADAEQTAEQADETPAQEQAAAPVLTIEQFTQAAAPAPQAFAGHTVAFTGKLTLSGYTHAQAAEQVKRHGGQAFAKEMPAFTTLLVVGENPGMKKLDRADAWINNVRKITEEQFLEMIA